jgi:hypothetical protein
VWHEPGVEVVTCVDELVTEPPAGVGVTDEFVIVVVVEGAAPGVGAVVVTELEVVEVVCANESGTARARETASALTASKAFMRSSEACSPQRN